MIKKIKYCLLSFIVLFSSCLDVNDDPNSLEDVDEYLLLPYAQASTCYVIGGRYQVLGALWSQHWTQSLGASQYKGLDSYDISSSTFNREFSELFAGALMNYEIVRRKAIEKKHWNYYLIATLMQCYTFQVLADLYEYIPFSETLKGDLGNLTPKYEYSQNIYDSIIARIDYALSTDYENDELVEIGDEDLIFQGDLDRWEEFANTLKLKIFIRQSEARPDVARAGIEALYEDKKKVNLLEFDAALWSFENSAYKRNPLYETEIEFLGFNPNLVISNTLLSFLQKNNDSRLEAMFDPPAFGGPYKGLDQGNYNDPDEPAGTNSNYYSKPVIDPLYPVFLFSVPEIYFLQAEAMIRFDVGDYDDAKEMYENGVETAFSRYGLTNAKDYYSGGVYSFPSEGNDPESFIEKITLQKWVALVNFQSMETFFEHNRTLYPAETGANYDNLNDDNEEVKFTVSVNNVTSNRFPRRLLFPESEHATNAKNTPDNIPVYQKLWWHKK